MANKANRLKRHGFTAVCYEFRCPRCKRALNCAASEVPQLKEGRKPYCYDCLKEGLVLEMRVTKYHSGPIDLHV